MSNEAVCRTAPATPGLLKIPDYTLNTKMSGFSYKMQSNVVLSGKFQLVICQNLSRGNK